MNPTPFVVSEELNIREALRILDSSARKIIFVTRANRLAGAVSDGDVRRWILKNGGLDEPVSALMNRKPRFVTENDKAKAVAILKKEKIAAIPLVNESMEILQIFLMEEDEEPVGEKIRARVLIMAGGKGERLLPYTAIVPKPLIPIGEKPILERIIDGFVRHGCDDFTLALNYKKNMIKAYFDDLERSYHIDYIEEDRPLGTGGALSLLGGRAKEAFFVSNCDIIVHADYGDIYRRHQKDGNQITIVASLRQFAIPYGVLSLGAQGSVAELTEKPTGDYLVNTGLYVVEPSVLEQVEKNEFLHMTDLIRRCIRGGLRVGTYPIGEEAWMDMGQFESMEEMKKLLLGRGLW